MRYIDFHTHITPEIDDGANSIGQAVEMLQTAAESGAQTVVLTPHFLSHDTISAFCSRRDQKISALKQALTDNGSAFPKLLAGAEVLLNGPLSEKEDLPRLCVEGTDVILLELPYPSWEKWHIQEVYHIIARHNLTPVMAHIERYLEKPKDIEKLDWLISLGAKFQINAPSFLTFSGKRVIKALAREGLICAIGSDAHNTTTRTPDISRAVHALNKSFGDSFLDDIFERSSKLLSHS